LCFEGFNVVRGEGAFEPVWSRSMLFKIIREDIGTTIMDNGFENSDRFERKWQ
jgi:hypothetical protein